MTVPTPRLTTGVFTVTGAVTVTGVLVLVPVPVFGGVQPPDVLPAGSVVGTVGITGTGNVGGPVTAGAPPATGTATGAGSVPPPLPPVTTGRVTGIAEIEAGITAAKGNLLLLLAVLRLARGVRFATLTMLMGPLVAILTVIGAVGAGELTRTELPDSSVPADVEAVFT
jgi:hypothetical protein